MGLPTLESLLLTFTNLIGHTSAIGVMAGMSFCARPLSPTVFIHVRGLALSIPAIKGNRAAIIMILFLREKFSFSLDIHLLF